MPTEALASQKNAPSLTRQATWLLTAKIIAFALSVFAPVIIVRVLAQETFGIYKQVNVVLMTGVNFLTLGFYMNLFYFLPRMPEEKPKLVGNVFAVHCAVGLMAAIVLLAWPMTLSAIGTDELARYAPLVAVALGLTIAGFFLEVVATANQDVQYSAAFIVLAQLTKGIAMVTAALTAGTLEAILYAIILQAAIQMAVLLWYLRRAFPGFFGLPDLPLMSEQISYAAPFFASSLATLARTSYHHFVVANHVSAAEYAIYAVGCTPLPLINVLRESVYSVMIPRVSYLQQHERISEIVSLAAAAARKLALVQAPAYAFFFVAGGEFITALYTSQYSASKAILIINIIPLLFVFPSDPINRAFAEQRIFALKLRICTTIVVLPAVYIGMNMAGMYGAIVAVILTMAADHVILLLKVTRTLGIGRKDLPLFADLSKVAGCSVAAAVATEIVRRMFTWAHPLVTLVIAAVVFGAVYVASLLALDVPTTAEKATVRAKLSLIGRRLGMAHTTPDARGDSGL